MSDFASMDIPDALRAIMERRGVKMTQLADRAGIPYRSLQNYLYKKSSMPVEAYLKICANLGVPADYPSKGRFNLPQRELTDAVQRTFGDLITRIDFDADLTMRFVDPKDDDARERRRTAGLVASLLSHAYDAACEITSRKSLSDDDDK